MAADTRGLPVSRRQLLLAGLALAGNGLLAGCAMPLLPGQRSAKVPRIGYLAVGSREGRAFLIDGFLQGLREHGYTEGQNVLIEYRFSQNDDTRLPALAAELVALKVDLIMTSGAPASFAAARATRTIPVILGGIATDPVEAGLVASLAHPGGNVTGMSQMSSQLSGKRLELLKDIVPGLARVAVFWNPPNPALGPVLKELEAAALGLELQCLEVRVPEDFPGAFAAAGQQRADALIMPGDPLTTNRANVVADLALQHRLPAMMEYRHFVVAGGLLSVGVDLADLYRRSAEHVDKILKGAKPADLPVQQPTMFEFVINLQTAQALGLTIPQHVLLQATEVIQ
ncbi:MAG TPA: ABC transporter substrate-binding protein [Chloroflexota bacterium]|jgi:putative ABC transport system substrate-binding protein